MELLTDEQLIARYLETTDETLLQTLIERHLRAVYNFVYRYVGTSGDAEDITQDVFVSAWEHLRSFDQTKKFTTWIFAIAKNTSLNWLKKKKPALFSEFENAAGENWLTEFLPDPSALPDELFAGTELRTALAGAVAELPPHYQAVLSLRYSNDLTFQEIGKALQKPLHTVKSQHRRAVAALKKLLQA